MVPFLVIVISIVGFFLGQEAANQTIVEQVGELIGAEGAELFKTLAEYSFFKESGLVPTIISGTILIAGALGVFIELKESLNIIWGIEIKPGNSLKLFFKNRLFTFPIIFAIGLLFILSVIISALINIFVNYIEMITTDFTSYLPILQISDIVVSVIVFTILFAMLFKYLPDADISWSYIWQGALFTSILFNLGKYLIGIYLGNTYYGNVYGAAGSLVLLLIWIYYSSLIFFFGAEFTYVIRMKYAQNLLKINNDFLLVKKNTERLEEAINKLKKPNNF